MNTTDLNTLYENEEKRVISFSNEIEEMIRGGRYPSKLSLPLSIQLELTDKCNLKCKHCYNRSGEKVGNFNLKLNDWLGVARNIISNGGVFQVIISGGEPLMLKNDLFKIMDEFHNDNSRFVFITNGFLINKSNINKLKKYSYAWMQVSIDGVDSRTHDLFRQRNGSWERAIVAATLISSEGIPLKIACSLPADEIDKIDAYIDQAYQLGASAVILGDIMPSGRAVDFSGLTLTENQKEIFLNRIHDARVRYQGIIEVQTSSFIKLQLKQASSGTIDSAIIRPTGDVRLDCVAPFVIGNVLQEQFSEIWRKLPGDVWRSRQVQEYIESIDKYTGQSTTASNYNDTDFLLQRS